MPDLATFDTTMQEHLQRMREKVAALAISDQQTYLTAVQVLLDTKAIVKEWEKQADAEIDPLRNSLDRARNKWKIFIEPGKSLLKALTERMDGWKAEERRQAKIEEDRKNEELRQEQKRKAEEAEREGKRQAEDRRKQRVFEINRDLKAGVIGKREAARRLKEAGADAEAAKTAAEAQAEEIAAAPPPRITVVPSIPKAAGVKTQIYYFAELVDANMIIRDFLAGDAERRAFLRQFITVDEAALGKFARDTKDSAKAASLVPGVKFTERG